MERNQSSGKTLLLLVGDEEDSPHACRNNAGCAAATHFSPGSSWLFWVGVAAVTPLSYHLHPCQ